MKLVKNASGKEVVKMSKAEWKAIGKQAGWTKIAEEQLPLPGLGSSTDATDTSATLADQSNTETQGQENVEVTQEQNPDYSDVNRTDFNARIRPFLGQAVETAQIPGMNIQKAAQFVAAFLGGMQDNVSIGILKQEIQNMQEAGVAGQVAPTV